VRVIDSFLSFVSFGRHGVYDAGAALRFLIRRIFDCRLLLPKRGPFLFHQGAAAKQQGCDIYPPLPIAFEDTQPALQNPEPFSLRVLPPYHLRNAPAKT